jgi:hypothetical protein
MALALDFEWEQFLNDSDSAMPSSSSKSKKTKSPPEPDLDLDSDEEACEEEDTFLTETTRPKCTPIYISTKTKISYLTLPIVIHDVFWKIPILK